MDLTLSKSEGLNKQKGCAGFFEIQYSSQECNFVWLLKKKKKFLNKACFKIIGTLCSRQGYSLLLFS